METDLLSWFTAYPLLLAFSIFLLRVTNMTLDTLRVLFVVRGRKLQVWVMGFLQSALWIMAITAALSNLDNIINVIAYAAGFATGNVIGMRIEERLAIGHVHMRIISSHRGSAISESLRSSGYAVTELPARGKDGTVSVINCSVLRRDIGRIRAEVSDIDPDAFITIEDMRPLNRGFWRA
jgi:uncharacterized protein YebE (UPF0316 family)